jgi:methylglutaconyl-CoA hydratase
VNRIVAAERSGVGRITLARPDRRNALDREAADDLLGAISAFEADPAVKVIVLDSSGDDFCAGADLHALKQKLDAPLAQHEEDARALANVFMALHNSSRPTVALVRGVALAGGAALATACDVVAAAESANFGYPEVAVGFVPAIALAFLVRAVGEKRAFELVATGRRIGAREAADFGLISFVWPDAEFEPRSSDLVARLASAPGGAMSATKALVHSQRGLPIELAVAAGVLANARARLTDDFRKGVTRFAERRSQ